jgi:P27 family predicted phage terminase small subunit
MAGNWNSGRRPKPTRLHVMYGTHPLKKRTTPEPQPPRATEDFDLPPLELDGDNIAIAEWRRIVPILRVCGLVSNAERSALIALCQQWSRYLEAQQKVRQLGMIVKKPSGIPVVNPFLAVADHALAQCQRMWSELGLTPSGRARISALPLAEPQEASKWAGLL